MSKSKSTTSAWKRWRFPQMIEMDHLMMEDLQEEVDHLLHKDQKFQEDLYDPQIEILRVMDLQMMEDSQEEALWVEEEGLHVTLEEDPLAHQEIQDPLALKDIEDHQDLKVTEEIQYLKALKYHKDLWDHKDLLAKY